MKQVAQGDKEHVLRACQGHEGNYSAALNPLGSYTALFFTRKMEDLSGNFGWPLISIAIADTSIFCNSLEKLRVSPTVYMDASHTVHKYILYSTIKRS